MRATTDISVLDPGYMTGGVEIDVLRAVVPRLAAYKVEGDRVELGADRDHGVGQPCSEDGLGVDFVLKPGFTWTNGFGEVTAEDVKYSLERLPASDWGGDWTVTGPGRGHRHP